jgi:hypothetical protein
VAVSSQLVVSVRCDLCSDFLANQHLGLGEVLRIHIQASSAKLKAANDQRLLTND